MHTMITWPVKDIPSAEDLTTAAREGLVYFQYVLQSGENVYAIVACNQPLNTQQAQTLWDELVTNTLGVLPT